MTDKLKQWVEGLIRLILNELFTPVGAVNLVGVVILYIFYWRMKQWKLDCLDKARGFSGADITKQEFFKKLAETSHFEECFPYLFVGTVILSLYFVYRYVAKRNVMSTRVS